ncbi:molybdopterin-guanine dinucleotide biosynthesis protein B [Fictibacillus norfolkensis]|uniref:Molybdopterin-guanine dinucleotide biosynthesis protein B n=1 Tax=Fictibacillus norfolkensis TaxID=2762233 RepID=A0ABR8SQA8_9BACL|nr:molybdopterin-guanine dinucleotide biosynthesis protein B [Fictibacillus norfolkensis]MBD7965636.1 molybdopterin-guanine dinucleotide biosynthesis protein B [Fictibacillus norfolkensis]
MGSPVILQVVGYQNSGKTTLISKLLKELGKCHLQVGVIKHHGHGDRVDFNDVGKDTEQHRDAGAYITCVTSSNNSILTINSELPLNKAIALNETIEMDCILIEGYKHTPFPRVILLRNEIEDMDLVLNSHEVIAAIHSNKPKGAILQELNSPQFIRDDEEGWLNCLITYITQEHRRRVDHENV